jgi:hypothetical protein
MRWETLRAAIGVVKGEPADAIEDTAALHDEEPFKTFSRIAIPSVDVPGTREWIAAHRAEHEEIGRRGLARLQQAVGAAGEARIG